MSRTRSEQAVIHSSMFIFTSHEYGLLVLSKFTGAKPSLLSTKTLATLKLRDSARLSLLELMSRDAQYDDILSSSSERRAPTSVHIVPLLNVVPLTYLAMERRVLLGLAPMIISILV
jgi:hypothetical protein